MTKKHHPKNAELVPTGQFPKSIEASLKAIGEKVTEKMVAECTVAAHAGFATGCLQTFYSGGFLEAKKVVLPHGQYGKFEDRVAKLDIMSNLGRAVTTRTLRRNRAFFRRVFEEILHPSDQRDFGRQIKALQAQGLAPAASDMAALLVNRDAIADNFLHRLFTGWDSAQLLKHLNESDKDAERETERSPRGGGGNAPEQTDFFTELKGDIEKIQNRWEDPAFIALPTDKIVGYGEALIREGKKIVARAKGQPEPQD